jgi:methyl-accepting chemotaxis protein
MTDDIVTRLRRIASLTGDISGRIIPIACTEAADEIGWLRNALAEQTIIHEVQKTNTLSEIEHLRKECDNWKTASERIAGDLEKSDDEVERLTRILRHVASNNPSWADPDMECRTCNEIIKEFGR